MCVCIRFWVPFSAIRGRGDRQNEKPGDYSENRRTVRSRRFGWANQYRHRPNPEGLGRARATGLKRRPGITSATNCFVIAGTVFRATETIHRRPFVFARAGDNFRSFSAVDDDDDESKWRTVNALFRRRSRARPLSADNRLHNLSVPGKYRRKSDAHRRVLSTALARRRKTAPYDLRTCHVIFAPVDDYR